MPMLTVMNAESKTSDNQCWSWYILPIDVITAMKYQKHFHSILSYNEAKTEEITNALATSPEGSESFAFGPKTNGVK